MTSDKDIVVHTRGKIRYWFQPAIYDPFYLVEGWLVAIDDMGNYYKQEWKQKPPPELETLIVFSIMATFRIKRMRWKRELNHANKIATPTKIQLLSRFLMCYPSFLAKEKVLLRMSQLADLHNRKETI
jgi:hypothetical protein